MRLSVPTCLSLATLALASLEGCQGPDPLTSGSAGDLPYTRSGSSRDAPQQQGALAAQLTGCIMETVEPGGSLQGALPGVWLNYDSSGSLLAFDPGSEVALYTLRAASPQVFEVSVRGRYQLGGQSLSVTWADGAVEQNTPVVENVPGCVMLSFTERTPRLNSTAYFERMHCDPVPGAPSPTPAPLTPPAPPAGGAVDAGAPGEPP